MLDDVRDYLRKQLVELADSDLTKEDLELRIKRANATVSVANAVVGTVRAEIDAVRAFADTGLLPASVGVPKSLDGKPPLKQIAGACR